jgi:hypothetical protein
MAPAMAEVKKINKIGLKNDIYQGVLQNWLHTILF